MTSRTVYVGNLSHFTTEEQIHELFMKCGAIDKIIMGLDRNKLTPCGFCFVIYRTEQGALNAMKYLQSTILDSQSISIDLDPGFREGRQFGRGKHGGQAAQEAALAAANGQEYERGSFRGRGRGGYRGRGGLEVDSEADSGVEAEVVELAVVVVNSGRDICLHTFERSFLQRTWHV